MHARWRNDRVLEWCSNQGIHVTAYAPMSSPQMADSMDKGHLHLLEASLLCTSLVCLCQLVTWTLHQQAVPSMPIQHAKYGTCGRAN